MDGINFRPNKTLNGVPPAKKIKEGQPLNDAPKNASSSSQEPMDQDRIVVAAMTITTMIMMKRIPKDCESVSGIG